MTTPRKSTQFQQTLDNFDNFNLFFTKLSGINPYAKRIDWLGGHEIMPSVYGAKPCRKYEKNLGSPLGSTS